jgi:membrane-associated phospholipid phosphatase
MLSFETLRPSNAERRTYMLVLVGAATLLRASPSAAQAARSDRQASYYWLHGGISAAGFITAYSLTFLDLAPGYDFTWFGPDRAVQQRDSPLAATVSDYTRNAALLAPMVAYPFAESGSAMWNAALIYAESHAISNVLTVATKTFVARPRPYTHRGDLEIAPADPEGGDAPGSNVSERRAADYRSFYSGHTSAAMNGATAGSLLFSETDANVAAKSVVWGVEFGLASLTGHLRIQAGKHYYTDVFAGTIMGAATGIVIPLAHGLERTPTSYEVGAGIAGLAVGWSVGYLFPSRVPEPGLEITPAMLPPSGPEDDAAVPGVRVRGVW